jgi:inositol-1,3,4-trisphosphate 5/6-kinase/inositol-tetrakisphosphate 1-kinase
LAGELPHLYEAFKAYLAAHPDTVVVDPIESSESSLNRNVFLERLKAAVGKGREIRGTRVRAPWNYLLPAVTEESVATLQAAMQASGITFPLMIKTEQQTTVLNSHTIRIAFSIEGIRSLSAQFPTSVIVQEFVNHNAVVYKVYTIGSFSYVMPRKSCSNITHSVFDFIDFDSSKPWPVALKSLDEPVFLELDAKLIEEVSELVSDFTMTALFGYDILVQADTGDIVIVDFNSFPGYKELTDISLPLAKMYQAKLRRS